MKIEKAKKVSSHEPAVLSRGARLPRDPVRTAVRVLTLATQRFNSSVEVGHTPAAPVRTVSALRALNQTYIFAASMLASLLVFWAPVHRLLHFAGNSEFSYIPLIPGLSTFLVVIRRHSIFRNAKPDPFFGSLLVAIGVSAFILANVFQMLTSADRLSLQALGIVITWWGVFISFYGLHAARNALLPLCLLLFIVPPPQHTDAAVIVFLQHESAVLSSLLFRMIGVPTLRQGVTIFLPGLTIEVAPECSGIRSSISLLILTLAGIDLYLHSPMNKILLASLVVPLCILKNAIRIVTLSTLALYVNPGFLTGPLHHRGGIAFFFLAFAILASIVILMRRSEKME